MTDFSKLSKQELNKIDKNVLIMIIGVLQTQLNVIDSQLDFLTEQIALMNVNLQPLVPYNTTTFMR